LNIKIKIWKEKKDLQDNAYCNVDIDYILTDRPSTVLVWKTTNNVTEAFRFLLVFKQKVYV